MSELRPDPVPGGVNPVLVTPVPLAHARSWTLCGLALCALGAEAPRWAPEAGSTIERAYAVEHTSSLAGARARVNGELRDVEGVAGSIEVRSTTEISVTDEIAAIADGRPARLVRRFDDLAYEVVTTRKGVAGESEERDEQGSDLESRTVVFTWDDSDESYAHAWQGEAGDDALLAELHADAELRDWLPPAGIEVGTNWAVPISAFRNGVRRPCGQLRFHSEKPKPRLQALAEAALWEALEGDLRATWKGVRETGGRRLGVIAFAGDTSSRAKVENDDPKGELPRLEIEERQSYTGELLWDLEGRRAHSFELTAQGEQVHTQPTRVRQGETEFDVETVLTFTTGTRWTASFVAK